MIDPTSFAWTATEAPTERNRADSRVTEDKVIQLFDQFRVPLLRYLSGFSLPIHEAEEIVQDVFLALFRHLEAGKSEDNLRGWIFRVGHNLALKRRETEGTRMIAPLGSPLDESLLVDSSPSPEAVAVENQTRERLLDALNALPERDSQCLRLRAEGLRFREIAEILGISLGSVSTSLTRSVARLARVVRR
jgi:RNA polymerase sigma-70 factor, ECF subfamily